MKVTAERIDNHKVVLEMEIPQAEVSKAVDKAYHKLANKVNIPGFRKGKVPRKILEMRVGMPAILDEAFEIIAPEAYSKALNEQNIDPVSRPEIEVVTLDQNQPLVFKATVVAKPEIELGQFKGLKVAKAIAEVTDEQVNNQLETMRNKQAKMVVAEGVAIANGDFAIIDFEGFIDGEPFEGGKAQSYPLEIGSGAFIPGFEEQLIGAKAGDELEVSVAFPEDYHSEEFAGKPAIFKVTIQDVKRKEVPALDDDFAKDVSEFETLEELKADIQNKLKQAANDKAEREFRNQAIKQAVENSTVDVPEIMIEARIDNMIDDLDISLQNRGMKLDQYLQYTKKDMQSLRDDYRESALFNVKTDLMLEAVVKAEKLEVLPEDIEAEINSMAEAYGTSAVEVQKIITEQGKLSALVDSVLRKKSAQLIIDSAEAE